MERRQLLYLMGGVTVGTLGLGGVLLQRNRRRTRRTAESLGCLDVVEDPPDAVYVPSHADGMQMVGVSEGDEVDVMLAYTYPHPFHVVTGRRTEYVESSGTVHLMAVAWSKETRDVLPVESGPTFRVESTAEDVERGVWPMMSQQMGYHYGDNFEVGEGEVHVEVDLPAPSVDTTGDYEGMETGVHEFDFEFSVESLEDIDCVDVPEAGDRGALTPDYLSGGDGHDGSAEEGDGHGGSSDDGSHGHPVSRAPSVESLPGEVALDTREGDLRLVVGVDEDGLYVSPRTRYNGYVLPMSGYRLSVTRDGEEVYGGSLSTSLEPTANLVYRADVDVQEGDEVEVVMDTPPQFSRHLGYERSFLEEVSVEFSV
ncbi:MAG: DUF7350 domain-containing protein [Halobacteriota archaeon]